MGTTNRRLNVQVTGSVGGFEAAMNRVIQGTSRVASGFRSGNREAGLFSNQIKAVGTTARYWLAGQLVFGVMAAVQSLGQFKTQLGEIDALASANIGAGSGLQGMGKQLDEVGKQAILMSNRFGVSVVEVETYMQRFYTSFKPTGTAKQAQKQMQEFVDAHLELVTVLGSRAGDPNALAGGLAALVKAMPGGERRAGPNAQALSNYFGKIVTTSPSLSGQDIANAAGRLAQVKTLSGMSMEQLLAAFGQAAKAGGSSSVMIRGMTQLLGTSLMRPTRPQSLQVYRAAGLPTDPNMLHQLGGQKVLEGLITYVQAGNRGGGKRNLNLDAIYNAFSRQESVRQFVSLLSGQGVKGLREFANELRKANKEHFVRNAANRRLNQSMLVRMGVARQNLGISVLGGGDWPLENLIARPTIWGSNLAARHPAVMTAAVSGGLTIGAAGALRRFGAFSKLGRFGKLGGFLSGASALQREAIGGAITKEELPAAIAGGATHGTRGDPFWVTITPLSWKMAPNDLFGGGITPNAPPGPKTNWLKKVAGWGSKAAGPLALAARARGLVSVAAGAAGVATVFPEAWDFLTRQFQGTGRAVPAGHPLLAKYASGASGQGLQWTTTSKSIQDVLDRFATGKMGANRAETLLGNAKLRADFEITLKHPDGSTSKHRQRGVPVQLQGARVFPSAQGKPGSRGGGR